jgi:hypothetical protein
MMRLTGGVRANEPERLITGSDEEERARRLAPLL